MIETTEARILVVDDEPDMEFLLRQKFRKKIKEGTVKFDFASNGKEALLKLEKEDFDLILTDINMPEMDGLTLLDHIQKLQKLLKTIVISAYGDFSNIRTAMNRGAFDFITKPIDFNDLDATINKTLEEINRLKEGLEAKSALKSTLEEKEIAILEREKSDQSRKFKEQFLANMSHEIRTPLNAVIGMTNLVMNTELNDQQKKYLNSIKKASENLLIIINDILDLSKIEAGRMELEKINFSLKDVLHTIHETLQYKAHEKKINFQVFPDDNSPDNLTGDPVRLAQILINVASNAIKFTDEGEVTLRCQGTLIGNNRLNIEFKITDTGIGMAEIELKNIFESFSQANSSTTRKYGGTGLGLTITRQLIDLHRGNISVKSEVGKGSEFTINLPFEIFQGKIETSVNVLNKYEDISVVKILLVEDNDFNQIVAVDTLKDLFPKAIVDVAENGKIAVEKVIKGAYDLVLMDVQMPEMDGYTATKKIRENEATIALPIIAMTANAIKEEVDKCFESGMNDYIAKPFDPAQLSSIIIKALNSSNILNQ